METWDALRARRNVRDYADRPLEDEKLTRILEAGWLSPSASNRQHRDFVVVTERAQLQELSTVWQGGKHIAKAAAAVGIVLPEPTDERMRVVDQFDAGQAVYAMMLVAADLGVGTAHSSVGDQEASQRILGFPDGFFLATMFGVGYPADRPIEPLRRFNRRPFDEVVHRNRW